MIISVFLKGCFEACEQDNSRDMTEWQVSRRALSERRQMKNGCRLGTAPTPAPAPCPVSYRVGGWVVSLEQDKNHSGESCMEG